MKNIIIKIKKIKDSIYFASCSSTLDGMIKKRINDDNHYNFDEVALELKEWKNTEQKYFVVGSSIEEKRTPLKWKVEYETDSSKRAEMIALSR